LVLTKINLQPFFFLSSALKKCFSSPLPSVQPFLEIPLRGACNRSVRPNVVVGPLSQAIVPPPVRVVSSSHLTADQSRTLLCRTDLPFPQNYSTFPVFPHPELLRASPSRLVATRAPGVIRGTLYWVPATIFTSSFTRLTRSCLLCVRSMFCFLTLVVT